MKHFSIAGKAIPVASAQDAIKLIKEHFKKHSLFMIRYSNWQIGIIEKNEFPGQFSYPINYLVIGDFAIEVKNYFLRQGVKLLKTSSDKGIYIHICKKHPMI